MQITINENDSFSIVSNGDIGCFDGHCLRAYSYYKHLMPDITKKLEYLDKGGKFYKVTYDDGSVDYLSEFDETFKNLGETK